MSLDRAPPWRLMSPTERRRYWLNYWRLMVPVLVALGLVWLMTVPLPVAVPVFPQVALLSVFVWATFQPGLMPPWAAFFVGMVADLTFGQPVGVNATLFALAAAFVRFFEARYGAHGHGFDWAMATSVVIGFELGTWQLMALAGHPVPVEPLGWQVATSIIAYPVVVWLCAAVQRRVFGRPA